MLSLLLLVQIPAVQTFAAKKAIEKLGKNLDGEISVEKIGFIPGSGLFVKNITITDKHPYTKDEYNAGWAPADTFFCAESILASFTLRGLLSGAPALQTVKVEDAMLHLAIEPAADGKTVNNLQRIFHLPTEPGKPPGPQDVFSIRNVKVRNFRFRMNNFTDKRPAYKGFGFNWADLDVTASVDGRELKFSDGRMSGIADMVTAKASCGYEISSLTARTCVGRGRAQIDELKLTDLWSEVNLKYLAMVYDDGRAFSDFIHKVSLEGELDKSLVNYETIRYFSGQSDVNKTLIQVPSGGASVSGPVSDLEIRNIIFKDLTSALSGDVEHCFIKYLPDIKKMDLDFNCRRVDFTTEGLGTFVRNFSPKAKMNLSRLAKGEILSFTGKGHGTLNNLSINGEISGSNIGLAKTEMLIKDVLNPAPLSFLGKVETRDLMLDRLLGVQALGIANMNASLHASIPPSGIQVYVDSLRAHNLGLMGAVYEDIAASAFYSKDNIAGHLISKDPKLNADLNARMQKGSYAIAGQIRSADLAAMGFEKKAAGISWVSADINADFPSLTKEIIVGKLNLHNLRFTKGGNTIDAGDIIANAENDGRLNHITLDSKFADGVYSGLGRELDATLNLHDCIGILGAFVPGLSIADDSHIKLSSNGKSSLFANITSPKITFGGNCMSNLNLHINNHDGILDTDIASSAAKIGSIPLKAPRIRLAGEYEVGEGNSFAIKTKAGASFLKFNDSIWSFGDGRLSSPGKGLALENFSISSDDQFILAEGGLSKEESDTLKVRIDNVRLTLIDDILGRTSGLLGGCINGDVLLFSPSKNGLGIGGTISCDSLLVNGNNTGHIRAAADMKGGKINLDLIGGSGSVETIGVKGKMDTKSKDIDAGLSFNNFQLAMAHPFLSNLFSKMEGTLTGDVKASGKLDKPVIRGDSLRLNDARLQLAYTGVCYTLDGKLKMDDGKLDLGEIKLTDPEGGSGEFRGNLDYSDFKNMTLDAGLKFREMQLIDIAPRTSGFYGNAFATGDATVKGPFKSLAVDVNATTVKQSKIHVPLAGASAAKSELLTFKTLQTEDEIQAEPVRETAAKKKNGGLNAKVKLRAMPNLKAIVEINKEEGHTLTASGNGDITINYKAAGSRLELGGDYNITEGKYHFSALERVILKDFIIQSGSSIKFNGPIKNSTFDITALYNTKASITPLLSDTTAVGSRRNVICGLKITDRLANPNIKFSVDIPDLDPTTQTQVESALNTNEKVQKQFMSLLISGSFVPPEESGVVFNGENAIYSNLSSMMSGQINSILQTLNIPIDMGLNYQQAGNGKNIFDVAVSTQLFNNRVLVNGSIGNRAQNKGNGAIAGDLDIEIKIDKAGHYRVKVFSHSADDYTNFLDNTQRNGVGMTYRTDFNSFGELWKRTFLSKDARTQFMLEQLRAANTLKRFQINE